MKNYRFAFALFIFTVFIFTQCQAPAEAPIEPEHTVEVVAKDFAFDCPAEIPSGWHTVKFNNAGHAEHFFLLNLLPDSIDYTRYVKEVTEPFDIVYDSIKAGVSLDTAGAMLGSMIPSWYFTGVKAMGGPGIVDAGLNAWVSMKLKPGTYAMECYIKEDGVFHTTLGMIRPLTVTEDTTEMSEPEANYSLELTNFEFAAEGNLKEGWNTVAVNFKEHPEIGLGNDVHLIRMTDTTDIQEVAAWMNWMNIEGLEAPAPAEFLGGSQEMPVGSTSYFKVKLDKGDYAWISESAASRGMTREFTVE